MILDTFEPTRWILILLLTLPLLFIWHYISPGSSALQNRAPARRSDHWPVVGSLKFWTARWDFSNEYRSKKVGGKAEETKNFSFFTGPYHVVGLVGEEGRKVFFEDRRLGLDEGYAMLFGMTPALKPQSEESIAFQSQNQDDANLNTALGFGQFFYKRLLEMLKPVNFVRGLPRLIMDTKEGIDLIANDSSDLMDPFESVYRIVFRLTIRVLACEEIADDTNKLEQLLAAFEQVAKSSTPASVISPWWLMTPGRIGRFWGGLKLWRMLSSIANERKKKGTRREDAMQVLIEHGDDSNIIARWIINAVFAGYANTSVNAAFLLCYLATNPEWTVRVKTELEQVSNKYASQSSTSIQDRLAQIPVAAWSTEFPQLDLCIRETIRMTVMGSAFRWNTTTSDVAIGSTGEVIPPGSYATYHVGDVHQDPTIYTDPEKWDPSRYLPDRSEHTKVPHAFVGWGAARHPCLGQQTMVIAFFITKFDYTLCNADGSLLKSVPLPNRNTIVNEKPVGLRLRVSRAK